MFQSLSQWIVSNAVGLLSLGVTIALAFNPPQMTQSPESTQSVEVNASQRGPVYEPPPSVQVMVLDPLNGEWRPFVLPRPPGAILTAGDVVLLNTGERGVVVALGNDALTPEIGFAIHSFM